MDKIVEIKELLKETASETKLDEVKTSAPDSSKVTANATNPIFKKLAQFSNQKLTKKFDIKDLI